MQKLIRSKLTDRKDKVSSKSMLCIVVMAFVIQLAAFVLHGIGLYLLWRLFREGKGDVEHVYIFGLSAVEIGACFCLLLKSGLNIITVLTEYEFKVVKMNLNILLLTLITVVLYSNMFYILINKTLEVYLNILYPVHWSIRKAVQLEIVTWIMGCFVYITVCVAGNVTAFQYRMIFVLYFRPVFDGLFIISAVCSYTYLFVKYKQSKQLPKTVSVYVVNSTARTNKHPKKQQSSTWSIFLHSKFFISIALVFTFCAFIVLPDILQIFITTQKKVNEIAVRNVTVGIIYAIACIGDVLLYVLGNKEIKRLLYKHSRTALFFRRTLRIQNNIVYLPNS